MKTGRNGLKGVMEAPMSIWKDAPKNSREVFQYLKLLAEQMRVETYGEIASAVGKKHGRKIAAIGLSYPLGFIRDRICRPRSLPYLNALAVSASTRLPGDSFLPEGVAFGEEERILWRGTVISVFCYPWDLVKID
jgi:hypothetical protein